MINETYLYSDFETMPVITGMDLKDNRSSTIDEPCTFFNCTKFIEQLRNPTNFNEPTKLFVNPLSQLHSGMPLYAGMFSTELFNYVKILTTHKKSQAPAASGCPPPPPPRSLLPDKTHFFKHKKARKLSVTVFSYEHPFTKLEKLKNEALAHLVADSGDAVLKMTGGRQVQIVRPGVAVRLHKNKAVQVETEFKSTDNSLGWSDDEDEYDDYEAGDGFEFPEPSYVDVDWGLKSSGKLSKFFYKNPLETLLKLLEDFALYPDKYMASTKIPGEASLYSIAPGVAVRFHSDDQSGDPVGWSDDDDDDCDSDDAFHSDNLKGIQENVPFQRPLDVSTFFYQHPLNRFINLLRDLATRDHKWTGNTFKFSIGVNAHSVSPGIAVRYYEDEDTESDDPVGWSDANDDDDDENNTEKDLMMPEVDYDSDTTLVEGEISLPSKVPRFACLFYKAKH